MNVVLDENDQPVVFGNFEGQFDFDPSGGGVLHGDPEVEFGNEIYNGFAIRMTPDGNFVSEIVFDFQVNAAVLNSSGEMVFAGEKLDDQSTHIGRINADLNDPVVRSLNIEEGFVSISDIGVDPDSNIYAVGQVPTGNSIPGILLKLDSDFNVEWQNVWGTDNAAIYPL